MGTRPPLGLSRDVHQWEEPAVETHPRLGHQPWPQRLVGLPGSARSSALRTAMLQYSKTPTRAGSGLG